MLKTAVEGHMATTDGRFGLTLIEMIVCTVIIGILSATALPLSRNIIGREKEEALKENLRVLRESIDRYHDKMTAKNPNLPEESCYPTTLDDLVAARVLRRVPKDPMTNSATWRTRSTTDPIGAAHTDGLNIFDVFSTATGTASDGTPYSRW